MKALLEKNLVTIMGRASTPGRPLLYGTTLEFLRHFGLNEITDLPKPREIEELIGETEMEVDRRLLAEQQEIEFKEQLQEKLESGQRREKPSGRKHTAPVHQQAPPQPADAAQEPSVPVAESVERETVPAVEEPIVESASALEDATGRIELSAEEPPVTSELPAEEIAVGEMPASEKEPATPDEAAQKGWSKWKTKLQTFFRKLFA
jgi:hypothetical protein